MWSISNNLDEREDDVYDELVSMWPSICDSSEDIEEEEDEDFRDTTDNLGKKKISLYIMKCLC